MGRTCGNSLAVAVVVVGSMMQAVAVLDARAQEPPDRGVGVVAEQAMEDVSIELRVVESDSGRTLRNHPSNVDELAIGDRVQICFRVSQAGYVSLWSQDERVEPVQIYPNQFTSQDGRVDDTEQCLGRAGSGYSFQVEGPAGESLVFMHYSPEESNQIAQEHFPIIRRVRSPGFGSYASITVGFRIVQ